MANLGLGRYNPTPPTNTPGYTGELQIDVNGRLITAAVPTNPSTSRSFADSTVSVGVASGTVLAANSNRKSLRITNTSTTATVSLNVTDAAVLYQGITLVPGATWNMDATDFTTAAITGIASAATTVVSVMEIT